MVIVMAGECAEGLRVVFKSRLAAALLCCAGGAGRAQSRAER